MNDVVKDERVTYGRPSVAWLWRACVMFAALVLTAATVLLIPLSDLLTPAPRPTLEFRQVDTTAWKAPLKPPPPIAKPPPPQKRQERPKQTAAKPKLAEPRPSVPRQPVRLPMKLAFNPQDFQADFNLNFTIDPTVDALPQIAEPAPPPEPEPSVETAPEPVPRRELDQQPELIHQSRPLYPYRARQRGIEGYVDVQFTVDESGRVSGVETVGADPQGVFETAAARAVRNWKFKPGIRDGAPVSARLQIRIRFSLDR